MDKKTYLYFIQQGNDGPIKIGISTNPTDRLFSLQTANPVKLNMLCCVEYTSLEKARKYENYLHRLFSHLRMSGEWFFPKPFLIERIECVKINGVENIPEAQTSLSDRFTHYEVWDNIDDAWNHLVKTAQKYRKHGDLQSFLYIKYEIEDLLETICK